MDDAGLTRLPAGRHGLPREVVSANQRDRLIDAFVRVVVEKGFRATTIHDITSLASVSRNVFYEQFGGKDECFIAAYDIIRDHVEALMEEAARHHPDPPAQLVTSLRAMLRYFASEPELAQLCLVEPLSAGPAMTSHHEETLGSLVSRLTGAQGRADAERAQRDEVLILGALALVTRRINLGEAGTLESLLPELAQIILGNYMEESKISELTAPA